MHSMQSFLRRHVGLVSGALLWSLIVTASPCPILAGDYVKQGVVDVADRLEMFVDRFLIDQMKNARLVLHPPCDEGKVLELNAPWEGRYNNYWTVLKDEAKYRLYYRAKTAPTKDGELDEVTCYAESSDGIHWRTPNLGLFRVHDTYDNNVILDNSFAPVPHNFSPFLDSRPGVPPEERYKALGGLFDMAGGHRSSGGLVAFASADGIRWTKLREKAVINHSHYPYRYVDQGPASVFWSESEGCYVSYIRTWKALGIQPFREGWGGECRWIGRTTSPDFLNWTPMEKMEYTLDDFPDQLYLAQTHPYVRAPHIYLAITPRLSDHRLVITPEQARGLGVPENYWRDTSDVVFMTSRGGLRYDRTFMSSYLRPGLGPQNWVTRCSYPAVSVVQTAPTELSLYVYRDNAQTTAHLRRYSVRLDGFAPVNAPYEGGEMITRPLKFAGNELVINVATSASGTVRCEIQDTASKPVPGFSLADCREIGGDEIERVVQWRGGTDVSELAGRPVRLRFVMKDADLFALRFRSGNQ